MIIFYFKLGVFLSFIYTYTYTGLNDGFRVIMEVG